VTRWLTIPQAAAGFVYFIRMGPWVKIGYSIDPDRRLRTLQTASPVRLELLFSWPGPAEDEAYVQGLFGEYRAEGEWFRLEGRLADRVDDVLVAMGRA
jgi:hypothetical protein